MSKEEKPVPENGKDPKYAKIIIAALSVAAAFVITAVTILSLYFTGALGSVTKVRKAKEEEAKKQEASTLFTEYQIPSTMPTGWYANFTMEYAEKQYVINVYFLSLYASNTVNNFISYADAGFYNGTVFGANVSLLAEGKAVCGGYVRNSDGTIEQKIPKESASPIKGEFYENGYELNRLSNVEGMIGMIHSPGRNDDATTDFYMLSEDALELNGKYAAFAKITTKADIDTLKFLVEKAKNGEYVTIKTVKTYKKTV